MLSLSYRGNHLRSEIFKLSGNVMLIGSILTLTSSPLRCAELAKSAMHIPCIFWASDPVLPNETVLVTGEDLQTTTTITIGRIVDGPCTAKHVEKDANPAHWQNVPPLQATAHSVKFVIPAEFKTGIFACRLATPQGVSRVFAVNRPDPWWVQGDGGRSATAGGWLRICGKALSFGGKCHVLLTPSTGASTLFPAVALDGYSLKVSLPGTVRPGLCSVHVHNGFGGDGGWSSAGMVEIKRPKIWPLRIFNVMDFYGPQADAEIRRTLDRGSPSEDRTEAIEAALKKAEVNGGGVVFFPEGKYAFRGEIHVPLHTILRGAGEGLVTLWWGKGGFALDGGSDARRIENVDDNVPSPLISGAQFGIEAMSLYLPRNHQTAISAGDSFRMHRVRIRVDRYWIRNGQREEGTTVRMGNDGSITDCDIVAKGVAFSFSDGQCEMIAHNVVQAGKSHVSLERSDGAIIEDNDLISADPTAYINLSGPGRNIYYARNRHTSQFVHQSDFSWTFDGTGMAFLGPLSAVDGTSITLAKDPTYPSWAGETAGLWKGAAVCVLDGRGAGQYRYATANTGRKWKVDRPFDVVPDSTSVVNIIPFRGKVLVVGNRFEDASWVNMGYGSSFDVVCASNSLYRVGALLNEGLRDVEGIHGSWYIQYLDNEIFEGQTTVQTNADTRNMNLYAGPLTRAAVHRRAHFHADNGGRIDVGGDSVDVLVEDCLLDNPRGTISTGRNATGVMFRNNRFGPNPAPRYSGDGLSRALVLPMMR